MKRIAFEIGPRIALACEINLFVSIPLGQSRFARWRCAPRVRNAQRLRRT